MRLPSARIAVPSFGPEHIVVAVALLLLGLFLYAAVQTAQSNYRLQQTGRDIQQEVDDLRRQRAELAGLREYMATDEYVESYSEFVLGVGPGVEELRYQVSLLRVQTQGALAAAEPCGAIVGC